MTILEGEMKFADEMRGSVGERCKVTDLRSGKVYEGVVEEWDDATKYAVVRYENGTCVKVGSGFVTLLGDES